MAMEEAQDRSQSKYDLSWDDPLAHEISPVKHYLSLPSSSSTKAAVVLMHGRGDNITDMVDCFLPTLHRRFGGYEGRIEDDEDDRDKEQRRGGPVAVVGLEARDNIWYPESHNAVEQMNVANNEPYQYSALDKLRKTLVDLTVNHKIPLSNIVVGGFSQGAILADTYLLAGLDHLDGANSVPLPAYILSFAGSLFKSPPRFPMRGYASADHEKEVSEASKASSGSAAPVQPRKIAVRLLCGLADRFFPQEEIESAAASLVKAGESRKGQVDVQVSVGLEQGAPHIITPRMIAALVESLEEILNQG